MTEVALAPQSAGFLVASADDLITDREARRARVECANPSGYVQLSVDCARLYSEALLGKRSPSFLLNAKVYEWWVVSFDPKTRTKQERRKSADCSGP